MDPVQLKRDTALRLGTTDAFSSIEEAAELARSLTNGQGADWTIVTLGVLTGEHIAQGFESIRKAGTVVVTAVAPARRRRHPHQPVSAAMYRKRSRLLLRDDVPIGRRPSAARTLRARNARVDELVTRTYTLDEINTGYDDLHAGTNIRGVMKFPN